MSSSSPGDIEVDETRQKLNQLNLASILKSLSDTAIGKKCQGNEAYKKKQFDEALSFYDEAIQLDHTQIAFYNNKGAVYIEKKEFLLAKNVCSEAVKIGEKYNASSRDISRALERIGKACFNLGDVYNAMWHYKNALRLHKKIDSANELEKVDAAVKDALLRTDDLSVKKIETAGDLITRIYIDRQMRYKMEYETPVMFPRAPQQTFVDAFTEEDTSRLSMTQKDQQVQFAAEVELYRALENLECKNKEKIIVLHNFKFTKEQARLFSMSEGSSEDQGEVEQDFMVIVRGCAVILFEVKSPIQITNNNFKRNLTESRKQLDRAYELVSNISMKFGGSLSDVKILQFTVFPNTPKADLTGFRSYKAYLANKMEIKVLFQDEVRNFSYWWTDNVMLGLVKPPISSPNEQTVMQHLEASLIGLWCIDQKNRCNIDICSLGYCIKQVDKAIKSEHITHRKHLKKPVSKSVEESPDVFKKFLGVDCLTDEQLKIFEEDINSQFIIGPAGSGKTVLLYGKIIQLFQRSPSLEKKKFLLLTGTMDLSRAEELFSKVGMRVILSHNVYGGHRSIYGKLKLKKNESFWDAFSNNNAAFDIFILHHESLTDPSFWPENFYCGSIKLIKDIFSSVIKHQNYHTFIDDIHNYMDKLLASRIDNDPKYEYDTIFSQGVVRGLIIEMNLRLGKGKQSSYFWLVYDQSQMTLAFKIISKESIEKYRRRRQLLYLYDRDLKYALNEELEKNGDLFRSLSRDLRNTEDISLAIENVYKHRSYHLAGPILNKSLKLPKLFKAPGHHIKGPKPVCVFVKNSEFQEHLVHKVILDELEKLLSLGDHLSPTDVAIIYDSFTPLVNFGNREDPHPVPFKMMMKLQEEKFGEVTMRMTYDNDCIQASEWKAVIYVADLTETESIFTSNIQSLLDQTGSQPALVESYLSFFLSSMYVTLSRARAYLVVIGKLGGKERLDMVDMIARTFSLNLLSMSGLLHPFINNFNERVKKGDPLFKNGEYVYLKKSDFLYRIVDNSTSLPNYKLLDSSVTTSIERGIEGEYIWFRPYPTVIYSTGGALYT